MAQVSPSMKAAVASHSRMVPYFDNSKYTPDMLRKIRKRKGVGRPIKPALETVKEGRKGKSLVPTTSTPKGREHLAPKPKFWFF